MFPLKQKLMVPRSSLTTTTTLSVSSVMPSAARWREPRLVSTMRDSGMGKNTPARAIAQIADDDRAVVQLVHRLGHEQRDQQLARDRGVDVDALRDHELVQVRVLLEGDEGAHAVARELGRSGHHLVDHARLLRAREAAQEGAAAHTHQPRRMSFWKTTTTMRMIDERSVESRLSSVTRPSHLAAT